MSVTSVLKDLLQKELIRALEKSLVFESFANQKKFTLDKSGKVATVQTIPNLTANKVDISNAGGDITLQDVAITGENIEINQLIQDGFAINELDQIQSNIQLQAEIGQKMAYAIKDLMDQHVASHYTDAVTILNDGALETASNSGGTNPIIPSASNIYEMLTKARRELAKLNVPMDGIGAFFSPTEVEVLKRASLLDGTEAGYKERKGAGFSGKLEGIEIYETNNLIEASSVRHCLVMRKHAINLVSQMNRFKITEAEKGFRQNALYEVAYGSKVFGERGKEIIDLQVKA